MTSVQRAALGRRIEETIAAMTNLQKAMKDVDYAPDQVWTACLSKVKQLALELERLKKRAQE